MRCRPRTLPLMEQFFMTLLRLQLGLMEQDLAHRFGVSQSTASRVTTTWINLLYLKLKEILIWMKKECVHSAMPQQFKKQYPSTRVTTCIDATKIYVEQPDLPELQQITFFIIKMTQGIDWYLAQWCSYLHIITLPWFHIRQRAN